MAAAAPSGLKEKVVCRSFTPQQWRKTKCKSCFHDLKEHGESKYEKSLDAHEKHVPKPIDVQQSESALAEISENDGNETPTDQREEDQRTSYTSSSTDLVEASIDGDKDSSSRYSEMDAEEDDTTADEISTQESTPPCYRRREVGSHYLLLKFDSQA